MYAGSSTQSGVSSSIRPRELVASQSEPDAPPEDRDPEQSTDTRPVRLEAGRRFDLLTGGIHEHGRRDQRHDRVVVGRTLKAKRAR